MEKNCRTSNDHLFQEQLQNITFIKREFWITFPKKKKNTH